jgi:hypothetical protein
MPITSDSCLSGELAQLDMTLSMSIEEKPGSWAITALDAPPLAPDALPEVSDELPAVVVEPVASVPEPVSADVELDEPVVPVVPELASAEVEPDVPLVSAEPEPVVPVVPVEPEPAFEAVELVVSVVVEPLVPDAFIPAWFPIEPEAAWKPLI